MSRHDWGSYERAAEAGPLAIGFKVMIGLLIFCVPVSVVGYTLGWFSEAATVAREEFGPREALRKYEWFKDAAAQLEKKQADIKVYGARLASLKQEYGEEPRSKWARDDREQWSIWQAEAAGVRTSFNALAADYNAQMAKFNWRFANAGQLPEGAAQPLPREFKAYVEE